MSDPLPFHIRLANAMGIEPNTMLLDEMADRICPILIQHDAARTMAEAVAAQHGLPLVDEDGPLTVAEHIADLSAALTTTIKERHTAESDIKTLHAENKALRTEVVDLRASVVNLTESLAQVTRERDAAIGDRSAARSAAKMETDALRRQHATQLRTLYTALAAAGQALTQTAEASL